MCCMLNFPYTLMDASNIVIMYSGKAVSEHDCYVPRIIQTEFSPKMYAAP
jgi:hypothetical protein